MPALTLERIRTFASEAGFELCGAVPLPALQSNFAELDYFPEWIAQGRSGEMDYLKARNEDGELKRAAIGNVAPWAKTVIVCAINYNSAEKYSTESNDPKRGWISRYAWFGSENRSTDYHDAILLRLRQVEGAILREAAGNGSEDIQTRCYVDTGPLVERVYAKYAGIGWIAKNTCIINQKQGSWLFLGTMLTSLEVQGDNEGLPPADRCGSCTRCLEACPTGALTEPYKMDANLCIAYLTIEKRGEIPEELRDKVGNNVFGCDICQDVCPWNGHAQSNAPVVGKPPRQMPTTQAPEFHARPELVAPKLEWLAALSREEFNRLFRGSPIKRAKYQGIRRNAAVSMGNSGDEVFIPVLTRLAQDEDPIVAAHAGWALRKLTVKRTT